MDNNFNVGGGTSSNPTGIKAVAITPDSKIILGGGFTTVAGVARNHLA